MQELIQVATELLIYNLVLSWTLSFSYNWFFYLDRFTQTFTASQMVMQ